MSAAVNIINGCYVSGATGECLTNSTSAVLCCAVPQFYGYEVSTEGDAFLVAFHEPFDAVAWCLCVQLALHCKCPVGLSLLGVTDGRLCVPLVVRDRGVQSTVLCVVCGEYHVGWLRVMVCVSTASG